MPDAALALKAPIVLSDLLRPRPVQPHLAILVYHQVLEQPDPLRPGVTLRAPFAERMKLLRRHFNPVSLAEGVRRLQEGTLPPRCVCITFDDGYADNLTVAAPILAEHGIPATVFVAPGFLDGGVMWNDRVIEAIGRARQDVVDLDFLELGTFALGSAGERRAAIRATLRTLKYRPLDARLALVGQLERRLAASMPDSPMLSTAQLRELARQGVTIGAHTCHHPILRCEEDARAQAEIENSKSWLEDLLQDSVRFFAYPNGRRGADYDARHVSMVEAAGFAAAVSTDNGLNRERSHSLQLHRFTPWDSSPVRFGLRLIANEFRAGGGAA